MLRSAIPNHTIFAAILMLIVPTTTVADPIDSKAGNIKQAEFDIVRTEVLQMGDTVTFRIAVSGKAGESKPSAIGKLAGSSVYSYVWPTSLNSSAVGFEPDQGILALAATAHPDFDDTPAVDENGDGDKANDGGLWHRQSQSKRHSGWR
jgi:hypothetical protein